MGQTLSEPITEKHSEEGADERYIFGVSEMQGWRLGMEDAHTTLLELSNGDRNAFFAVYDGHGGAMAAKFAGENVHKRLVSEETYAAKDYTSALKRAFLGTDEDMRAVEPTNFRDASGCTAVTALLTMDGKIFVANAGDSRSIMSLKGEAKALSFDHKPQNESESSRIRAAGGYVEYGRVNGNLALSRALGDFEFKKNLSLEAERQIVTSDPEITVHDPTDEDEFLVLACDGIWDCLTSQQVIDICRRQIAEKMELKEICEGLMDKCLAPDSDINGGLGCDNMTVIIVGILHGRTKEEWYNWIAERVENKYGYETPKDLPELYSPSRISAAKDRWAAPPPNPRVGPVGTFSRAGASGFGALARVFGSNITFTPSGGITNPVLTNQSFDQDYSSDEESEDGEHHAAHKAAGNADFHGALRAPPQNDVNSVLRAQLEELKDGESEEEKTVGGASSEGKRWTIDDDGDSAMSDTTATDTPLVKSTIFSRRAGKTTPSADAETAEAHENGVAQQASDEDRQLQGEAPLPPKINGTSTQPVKQLEKIPQGDAPSAAVKAEGLMDKADGPILVKAD